MMIDISEEQRQELLRLVRTDLNDSFKDEEEIDRLKDLEELLD